jgi:hypothetical protein
VRTNGEVLVDIAVEKLVGSGLLPASDVPVLLEADLPAPLRSRLVSGLMRGGTRVMIDSEGGEGVERLRMRLEWTTMNRLTRADRTSATRELAGALTVYLFEAGGTVSGTEVIEFAHTDTVSAGEAPGLAGNWVAERFRVTDMEGRPGLFRRIAEPALVIVATGVTVFLLYNVRSR